MRKSCAINGSGKVRNCIVFFAKLAKDYELVPWLLKIFNPVKRLLSVFDKFNKSVDICFLNYVVRNFVFFCFSSFEFSVHIFVSLFLTSCIFISYIFLLLLLRPRFLDFIATWFVLSLLLQRNRTSHQILWNLLYFAFHVNFHNSYYCSFSI